MDDRAENSSGDTLPAPFPSPLPPAPFPLATFRFFPPSVDEQRAFLVQLGGAVLSFAAIGVLAWRSSEAGLRAVLCGTGLGVLFLLGRSAWQLERKAARAQNGEVGVSESGFSYTNGKGVSQFVAWPQIESVEVRGGRLHLVWHGETNRKEELKIGAREVENGMELIRLLAARGQSTTQSTGQSTGGASTRIEKPHSNFIPLEPK